MKNSSNAIVGQYFYDGDGKRVKKYVPATGETTVFVYDAAGKLVAEYSTIVEPTTTAQVAYLTNDHLGSPRINTDKNGNVAARHDYHPFGEEIATSQRNAGLGYADDTVRMQFTAYQRDNEIALDFAKNRFHSYTIGRFTSPDPLLTAGIKESPQSWNKYVYARNSPMIVVDPDGLKPVWLSQYDKDGGLAAVRWADDQAKDFQSLLESGWQRVQFDENGQFRYSANNGAGGTEEAILLSDGLWKWSGDVDNQVTTNPDPSTAPNSQFERPESNPGNYPAFHMQMMTRTDGERHFTTQLNVGPLSLITSQDVTHGRFGQQYLGIGVGIGTPRLSASFFNFNGRTPVGLVANGQACAEECVGASGNVLNPLSTSADVGVGSPQAGAGFNLMLPINPRTHVDIQSFPPYVQEQLRRPHPGYPRY